MALFRNAHQKFIEANKKSGIWVNANFDEAQALVATAEGGYGNTSADPGNWTGGKIGSGTLVGTKYGISAPVLKVFLGREPSAADSQNLTYDQAVSIYKANYWNPIKGDQIDDQDVANILYDASVNSGVGAAQKFAKDSLGTTTYNVVDVNNANAKKLFNDIGAARVAKYTSIGGYALPSWLNRLTALGYYGSKAAVAGAKKHVALTIAIALGVAGAVGFGIYLVVHKNKQ